MDQIIEPEAKKIEAASNAYQKIKLKNPSELRRIRQTHSVMTAIDDGESIQRMLETMSQIMAHLLGKLDALVIVYNKMCDDYNSDGESVKKDVGIKTIEEVKREMLSVACEINTKTKNIKHDVVEALSKFNKKVVQ